RPVIVGFGKLAQAVGPQAQMVRDGGAQELHAAGCASAVPARKRRLRVADGQPCFGRAVDNRGGDEATLKASSDDEPLVIHHASASSCSGVSSQCRAPVPPSGAPGKSSRAALPVCNDAKRSW